MVSSTALLRAEECHRALERLRPGMGSYRWLWPLLRLRARRTGGYFPLRLFALLRPFCGKPYFIGEMPDHTRFVGDLNDRYSAYCGMDPTKDAWLIGVLCDLADQFDGDVLDVGCNQGAIAAAVGRHIARDRKVVAFEPVPETAARAAATLALNELSTATLLPLAVGEFHGAIPFHYRVGQSDIATATRDLRHVPGEYRQLSVECLPLDSLLPDVLGDRVGVVKVDVEGAELQVVRGAQRLIQRDRPAIVFEYWPEVAGPLGWRVEDVADAITQAGGSYNFDAYDQDRLIEFPPPRNTGIYNIVSTPALA